GHQVAPRAVLPRRDGLREHPAQRAAAREARGQQWQPWHGEGAARAALLARGLHPVDHLPRLLRRRV
ncbi:unnamed protein product, partial [Ectocarpus sp. 12 AP-2014]